MYCTFSSIHWTRFVFVKHILPHMSGSWPTRVRFFHSWALDIFMDIFMYIYAYTCIYMYTTTTTTTTTTATTTAVCLYIQVRPSCYCHHCIPLIYMM